MTEQLTSDQLEQLQQVATSNWVDDKGKLKLPPTPNHDDPASHCLWMTGAFNLDRHHPIKTGARYGAPGPDGHVVFKRVDAPEIRFEPITKLGEPRQLIATLNAYKLPTDGMVHAFNAEHCRTIFHVATMLCAATSTLTAEQETIGIIGDLIICGVAIEGFTTHGTGPECYAAAGELARPVNEFGRPGDQPRYLVDANTNEIIVAVSELQTLARRHVGSSLPRGWLDARIEGIGWQRGVIDARQQSGRTGRTGPHRRVSIYHGHLDDETCNPQVAVTT